MISEIGYRLQYEAFRSTLVYADQALVSGLKRHWVYPSYSAADRGRQKGTHLEILLTILPLRNFLKSHNT
ncbi:hypothetical protein DSO57_1026909 [Entomophthora muscae]|uniref:Uncharacterized protein n=1 Tax=Entomophthora muscae TaxID=34485 RepID=A0ACC2RGP4_9FUNG|nr:hypothetical protein DSO57_1026909 [Entomophthora muscae]